MHPYAFKSRGRAPATLAAKNKSTHCGEPSKTAAHHRHAHLNEVQSEAQRRGLACYAQAALGREVEHSHYWKLKFGAPTA